MLSPGHRPNWASEAFCASVVHAPAASLEAEGHRRHWLWRHAKSVPDLRSTLLVSQHEFPSDPELSSWAERQWRA